MDIDIAIRNYRSFADSSPARLTLRPCVTSFVGKNNAGKSSLLKFFYELRHLFLSLTERSTLVEALRHNPRPFNLMPQVHDINALFCDFNDRPIVVSIAYRDRSFDANGLPKRLDLTVFRGTNTFVVDLYDANGTRIDYSQAVVWSQDDRQSFGPPGKSQLSHAYLTAAMNVLGLSLYVGPYRNAINIGTQTNYYDIAVGDSFITHWDSMRAGNSREQQRAAYRLLDDIKRIFELRELQANASTDNKDLKLIVDGRPYDLQEMGAGLAQFFIVFANVAFQRPTYVLIDEPELNLHPALQLDFIQALAGYAREGVVFGTHSLGLARTAAQCTYAVAKDSSGASTLTEYDQLPRLSEFVGELSFSGQPALGFSRILLVESRTDIRPIQQFLRRINREHTVLILPLGGSTLINGHADTEAQLVELTRITPAETIKALIDSERQVAGAPLEQARVAFRGLCERVGIECRILQRRALENYLTDEAVRKAVGPGHSQIGDFGQPTWNKNDNSKIASQMSFEDIRDNDLGQFLTTV